MEVNQTINWEWSKKLSIVRQTESSECGVACLSMIADWHGYKCDLAHMRRFCDVSSNGMTLKTLIECANGLKLNSRALNVSLDEMKHLTTPCVLHWDLNHFVVLKEISGRKFIIHDPAKGRVVLTANEVNLHFTGIAVEFSPQKTFVKEVHVEKVTIRQLLDSTSGFYNILGRIFVFSVLLELLIILGPIINQLVIDEVLVGQDSDLLILIVIGLLFVAFLQVLIGFVKEWTTIYLSVNLNMQWMANVFNHLVRLPMDWFEKRELGDISAKFDAVNEIQRAVTENIVAAILDGLIVIFTLVVMYIYSPKLTLVSIASALLYVLMRAIWFNTFKRAEEDIWTANAKETSHFLETVSGILSVRVNGGTPYREATWLNLNIKRRNAQLREKKFTMLYGIMDQSLGAISTATVTFIGATLVLDAYFSIGMFMAYLSFQQRFAASVFSVINKYFEFKMLSVYTERLADIVLSDKEQTAEDGSATSTYGSDTVIAFNDVTFRYSRHEKPIFESVTFAVKKGEQVALTGRSGSGKTTLAKLILGLYKPSEGGISVLGNEIQHADVSSIRSTIGSVFQDDRIFNGSIYDNISFFDEHHDNKRAEECAKLANVHDEITGFAMGYQTIVGEFGSSLSGGQKQRILLARALYKKPQVLLLDEATSSLDVHNERVINQRLREMGITIFQIAHRPETINFADRIIDMESFIHPSS